MGFGARFPDGFLMAMASFRGLTGTFCAVALSILVNAATPAAAALLELPGPYGNEAGCRFAANGDYGDDSLLLLTQKEVSSFATACMFTAIRQQGDGGFVADVVCSHEGEDYKTDATMRLEKLPDADAFTISDDGLGVWGTVERCN